MMKEQTILFKTSIETKRRELLREIHAQTNDLAIDEGEHDPVDRVQSMNRRDEAAIRLGWLSRILAEVDKSLCAMANGSYGLCAECGEPISLKRLETIPWVSLCLRCQELLEQREALCPNAA